MTTPADLALALPQRTGLPADVAYLLARHPRSAWRAQANFGEVAAFWLSVHDSLRAHGAQIGEAVTRFGNRTLERGDLLRYFAPHLGHFLQHLDGHHRIEDGAYFPRFRALDPRMARGIELLESDHALIHGKLADVLASGRALAAALQSGESEANPAADAFDSEFAQLRRWLDRHLADEEEVVIPALIEHSERSFTP